MRVLFFLFLLLLTDVCKGQHLFDYKKDSLATSFNVIRFAILAEEELAHSIYYIDAYSRDFLYKDEYGTREDFFGRARDLPKEKITIPLRHYNKFESL
jgi:hypothetical protein